jgi:hypothetical protein
MVEDPKLLETFLKDLDLEKRSSLIDILGAAAGSREMHLKPKDLLDFYDKIFIPRVEQNFSKSDQALVFSPVEGLSELTVEALKFFDFDNTARTVEFSLNPGIPREQTTTDAIKLRNKAPENSRK